MVKRRLASHWLNTPAFAAIVVELSEGQAFAGPSVVYPHERSVPPESFPSAEVLGISSMCRTPDSSVQYYDHTVDVLWTVAGDDEATLVWHAETLVLATRRMSFRQVLPMPGGTACAVIPGPEDYGPLTRSGGRTAQPLVKAARIRLVIPTVA